MFEMEPQNPNARPFIAGDRLMTPNCYSGEFLMNRCDICGRDWECYRYEFVCDDCQNQQPADGETASDRDQK